MSKKQPLTRRQKRLLKKRRRRRILFGIEIVILLILIAGVFIYAKLGKMNFTSLDFSKIGVNSGVSNNKVMKGYTTIGLVGLDNRSTKLKSGNSDTMIIASINNDTGEVRLASVFRDTYLDMTTGKFNKANSAYSTGGPEQAITMLNKNLDMDITDYVTVDFNAVVECVDLLGGVTIPEVSDEEAVLMHGYMDEINKLTKNNSKYLSGGGTNVEMDGVQACAYARIRYTTGDDYKRTERQRTVLTAMVQKAQKANLTTINSLIDELFGDIKTSFSNTELISLAAKVFNYSLGETIGFPFEKNTTTLGNKGSVVVPCDLESNVKQLHVFLYDDNEYAPTDTVKNNSAQIVNDTGFHQGEGY